MRRQTYAKGAGIAEDAIAHWTLDAHDSLGRHVGGRGRRVGGARSGWPASSCSTHATGTPETRRRTVGRWIGCAAEMLRLGGVEVRTEGTLGGEGESCGRWPGGRANRPLGCPMLGMSGGGGRQTSTATPLPQQARPGGMWRSGGWVGVAQWRACASGARRCGTSAAQLTRVLRCAHIRPLAAALAWSQPQSLGPTAGTELGSRAQQRVLGCGNAEAARRRAGVLAPRHTLPMSSPAFPTPNAPPAQLTLAARTRSRRWDFVAVPCDKTLSQERRAPFLWRRVRQGAAVPRAGGCALRVVQTM